MIRAEGAGNVDQTQAAAALAAAPLRGELENDIAAFPPAAEDAEQEARPSLAAAEVDPFGVLLLKNG